MRHYPKATPRRVWVIGASGLALCYPMRPRAKPSTRAALAAAFGPAPLVVGPASPALPSATPTHERRTGVIPSLNPGRSSRPRRGIRRPDGSGGNRELTTRTDLQAQQNDLIGSIADPASIEPDPAPIGSVRPVRLNAGHIAGLRRRSGPRSACQPLWWSGLLTRCWPVGSCRGVARKRMRHEALHR